MSCPKYRDSIVLLVDGELSDDAAHGVRSHLMGCDDCRAVATELERMASFLKPTSAGITHDETRFWRRFDADLAVRVARGEIPFWKRSITIPLPAMAVLAVVVVSTGVVAGRAHRHASAMEFRAQQLQAVLREARESTIFPATVRVPKDLQDRLDETPVRTVDVAQAGTMTAAAAPVSGNSRMLPMPKARNTRPHNSIRFVDSDGVLQPGDLY